MARSQKRKSGSKRKKRTVPAQSPTQPAPLSALASQASAFLNQGKFVEAMAVAEQNLAVHHRDGPLHYLAGLAAHQLQDLPRAMALIEQAVDLMPSDLDVRRQLGAIQHQAGRADLALATYRALVASAPQATSAEDHYRLAVLLQDAGEQQSAKVEYEQALARGPAFPDALLGLGNALRHQGELLDAAKAYREALELAPTNVACANNLGSVLLELEALDEAQLAYERALQLAPEHIGGWSNLGLVFQRKGQPERAVEAFVRARDLSPNDPRSELALGHSLQMSGDLDAAQASYELALTKLAPDDPFLTDIRGKLFGRLADVEMQRGTPDRGLDICQQFLAQHPGDSSLLAVSAMCQNERGESSATDRLLNFDRLIFAHDVETDEGVAALNRRLASHVLEHPSLDYAPDQHATRKGMHSGDLFAGDVGPIETLTQHVWQAARLYVARLSDADPDHPTLAFRPARSRLRIWGVVMRDGGHQIPHIHPAAWLSGVYYPQLPTFMKHADDGELGWIEFGQSPEEFHHRKPMPTRTYRPEEGRMFLFPGYFYHRTVAYDRDEVRISIAFDFVAGDDVAL
ncbi:MAG: tetratricopeptide repeat protein [Gammaproteobacteria bacterium]|nr:tetratricopeptide repeat protein [Gammaproteobacteria bacterium]